MWIFHVSSFLLTCSTASRDASQSLSPGVSPTQVCAQLFHLPTQDLEPQPQIEMDKLLLQIRIEGTRTQLPAQAALLGPAERNLVVVVVALVDKDHATLHPRRHAVRNLQ